ncbi:MAG: Stp1/IreP family PP2C-type Ser/Thr phosphatase [Oscillospiraceae bacterium]
MYLAYKTDIGKSRDENQDSVRAGFISDNIAVAVVCDGMGGAKSGEVASKVAVENIYKRITNNYRPDLKPNSIRNLMLTAVHAANTIVHEKSKEDIDKNGMGTTCVAALADGKHCYVVSVGDSRLYLLQENKIEQITTDHTYVQMLYDEGLISKEEQKNHKMRNVITRALGVEPDVEVDYFEFEVQDNYTLLLCTDGLSNYCDEELMYNIVFGRNLEKAVCELVDSANEQGGKDNITVALIAN